MKQPSTATLVLGQARQRLDPKEHAKLNGMTEWFMPKEINEMQVRLNSEFLQWLKGMRGYGTGNG